MKSCVWCQEKHLKMREQPMQSLVIEESMEYLWKEDSLEDEKAG